MYSCNQMHHVKNLRCLHNQNPQQLSLTSGMASVMQYLPLLDMCLGEKKSSDPSVTLQRPSDFRPDFFCQRPRWIPEAPGEPSSTTHEEDGETYLGICVWRNPPPHLQVVQDKNGWFLEHTMFHEFLDVCFGGL